MMLQLSPIHTLNTFFRLGINCLVQAINKVHVFGEKFISEVALVATTKWKLILFIFTAMYIFFKLLQKTRVEIKATEEAILITKLFQMIKNIHKPGITTDVISLIEKHKIDVNRKHPKSECGLTLFLCACLSGDSCLILYMLNKGADINSNTSCKDSPLHLASFCCGTQKVTNGLGVITSLCEAGCNINSRNWVGNTPLTIAASSGNCNLVRHLMSLGADKNLCSNDGIYPMDFAINNVSLTVFTSPSRDLLWCTEKLDLLKLRIMLNKGGGWRSVESARLPPMVKFSTRVFSGNLEWQTRTPRGHLDAANLLAIAVPNPHVWDIVEPHTPPRVKLGLQSPCKQHLVNSSFRRSCMDFTKKEKKCGTEHDRLLRVQ